MKRKWKVIKGYDEDYIVNEKGDVYSLITGRYISKNKNHKGYYYVTIMQKELKKNKTVHRIVAENFIENPENKPCVNHIDGNKKNNHVNNLEWVTYKENHEHSLKTGLLKPPKGDKHWTRSRSFYRKLSDEKVIEIKDKLNEGRTQTSLGEEYGVNQSAIWMIKENRYSILKYGKKY